MTALSLTKRDVKIVLFVYIYGGVLLQHVQRRFFPSSRSHTPCSERVSLPIQAGYLQRQRLPSSTGLGSGRSFLTLGPAGRQLVADILGASRTELSRSRLDAIGPIYHHLAICDFRLSVELACLASPVFALEDWTTDPELHRAPLKAKDPKTQEEIRLIPDAAFTLALSDGTSQSFRLEQDMGTVSPKRLRAKLRGYLDRTEDAVPVLFVVPDKARQSAVARWAKEEATALKADPTLFWITTKDQVTEDSVLARPIWSIVGGPSAIALNQLAGVAPEPIVQSLHFQSPRVSGIEFKGVHQT